MNSKDKRRYPRVFAKNVSAHLNVADQSSPCVIQNISAGGIFIETAEALPVGMPVAVNLARPGWTKVLRLSGRVVWAMAARTAAKKGTLPGMRIKFDALSQANASDLMMLLKDLGAIDSPPPLVIADDEVRRSLPKDPTAITQPVSLRDIHARVSQLDLPAPGHSPPRSSASNGGRANSFPQFENARIATPDAPRLIIQVQGLLMQMGELQTQLEQREKELVVLRERLKVKEEALDKSDRERKAAELAIQRLAMQLSSRR